MSFCYDAKTPISGHILTVKDNHKAFSGPPTVSYAGMFTDSVRGCFYWTPRYIDTGLKIFTVTITDSTCTGVGIPLSSTYAIPIYVWPVTTILNDTIMCPGDSITLTAIGGGGYAWDIDSSSYPGSGYGSIVRTYASGSKIVVKPTVTTQYTVYSTKNVYCAKTRDTVTILVVPPAKKLTIDTAACVGSTIQLYVPDTTPTAGISTTFKWTPPTYLSNANIQNPYCTPFADALYTATVTYGGVSKCATTATVRVKALHYFKLLNKDTSVCKNVPVSVNASGDGEFYYTWTPSFGVSNPSSLTPTITADTTRTYTLTARHVACPDSSASFTITVEQTPLVSAGQDKTICAGDTLHLFGVVVPNTYPYTYSWKPDTSVTNPNAQNTIFKGTVTTDVIFTATTSAGCKGSDTVKISVLPSRFLQVSPDTGICPGDTAHLRAGGDSLVSVIWRSEPMNLDDTLSFTPSAWPSLSQSYVVYGKNVKNCRDTVSIHVTVNPAAVINLPDSIILYPGNSYQINPQGNCLYYTWTPPFGLSSSTVSNPVAQPDVNTRYYAHGITEAGCRTTDSIDIYVADDSYISVPNAFTPGSGPGSVLKVLHLGDAQLKSFVIYNRWGIKMFETSNVNEGWDGMFNGKPQPLGVYVYTVEAYTAKGKRVYKQGNVTLLR
jgi:gliding motility-associated-like protein